MSTIVGGVVAVAVLFTIFVAPLWIIFNYLGKTKSAGQLTKEDEQMLSELWQMARKMDERMKNLETIFDIKEERNENQ